MERCHHMPFGARVLAGGGVRFQVWAPAAHAVAIALDGVATPLPMERELDGWYRLETTRAGHGSRYRLVIDDTLRVADPASRYQPDGPEGSSEVVDPRSYRWRHADWKGRPWAEAVIHELHVGSFAPGGDFDAVRRRLDYLAGLGITALELMPVAEGPGRWSWGYDAVLPFAPRGGYGGPNALKRLIDAAHGRGLMVLLDVIYNHFGPQGNYLPEYAPGFFSRRHRTPWGQAINFDGEESPPVRQFFIHNALYWLEEYGVDGLRLDAVHAIFDNTGRHILDGIAHAVHQGPAAGRQIHLVLENDANESRYLRRNRQGRAKAYKAQWNDDLHHALHVLLTGETGGYYRDYADDPCGHLLRCLEEGFAWQGEPSAFRGGKRRGEPSAGLPPTAFVSFLQNHDQIGNRAGGERIGSLASPAAIRAATALLLLAPFPPLLFMGQEWGSRQPFPFFCDFEQPLSDAVREGRRREFGEMAADNLPDPCNAATFAAALQDWRRTRRVEGREWLAFHRRLLELRRQWVAPVAERLRPVPGAFLQLSGRVVAAAWSDGRRRLDLLANLGPDAVRAGSAPAGECLFATPGPPVGDEPLLLSPWTTAWYRGRS